MCPVTVIIFPRNVSFRGYYVFVSNAAAAPPPSRFVVSAITFEGFKLRSSNLTHVLFIQISRTSSITDIVVQSKMAAGGHFVQKFQKKKSCVSIWNGKNCDRKLFSDIQNGRRRPCCPKFLKSMFSHLPHFSPLFTTFSNFFQLFPTFPHFNPLFPPRFVEVSAITFEGFKLRSSNLTHVLFIQISRTSSITDIVVQSKMAAGGHFVQKFQKKKCCVSIWNGKNCDRKLFSDIQNGRRRPCCPKFLKSTFSHLPHFSPLFTTFSNFFQLFAAFSHFSPLSALFPTFSNFSPTFSNFSPLFPTLIHFSPFFPPFPTFFFANFSPLFTTFHHF